VNAGPGTTDDDLMDLSSRFAYRKRTVKGDELIVNTKSFWVVDVVSDPETGLDAITVRNDETNELTVAFQGTQGGTDVLQDAALVTSGTPTQFAAAHAYVLRMQQKHNTLVGSVCGNSLGGGLAAYVSGSSPWIRAVTVNPAPVPHALSGRRAPQVRNYISPTDPLHRAVVAGGLEDRIIGEQVRIPGTSFNLAFLGSNHIGSDREDGPYDASMAVPFSLFHADRRVSAGRFGAKVAIDADALGLMGAGLRRQREDLRAVLATELVAVERTLEEHGADLGYRAGRMREKFVADVVEAYRPVQRTMTQVADQVERLLRSPFLRLPRPPGPLRTVWVPLRDPVLDAVADVVRGCTQVADLTVRSTAIHVWDQCDQLLLDESRDLTRGLLAQSAGLRRDLAVVDRKWDVFATATSAVTEAVVLADDELARAIAGRRCPADAVAVAVPPWPWGTVGLAEADPDLRRLQDVVETRQDLTGHLARALVDNLLDALSQVQHLCRGVLIALDVAAFAVGSAATAIRNAVWAFGLTPPGAAISLADGAVDLRRFSEDLDDVARAFRGEAEHLAGDVRRVEQVLAALPDLVDELGPYLVETFFADAVVEEAYDSYARCRNLVARSELAFGEVTHQLDEHDARMIDALAEHARELGTDLGTVHDTLAAIHP
jgi:hypothetical protein